MENDKTIINGERKMDSDSVKDDQGKAFFEKYHETFYGELHGWRDYAVTSAGYGEWYYDCLPPERTYSY